MQQYPFVSVVIPTYKDRRLLFCLDSLLAQDYPSDAFEVVVVDNEGTPSVEELCRVRGVSYLYQPKPGSYAARNLGIHRSKGDIIAFTDSDCVAEPSWLTNGVACLMSLHRPGWIGGRVSLFSKDPRNPTWAEQYESLFAFDQEQNVSQGASVTANLFAPRSVFLLEGVFRDDLLSGGDGEWTQRVANHEHDFGFCSDAVVWHPARRLVSDLVVKKRRIVAGRYTRYLHGEIRSQFSATRILLLFAPPINSINKAVSSPYLQSWKSRIMVILLAWMLKVVTGLYRLGYRAHVLRDFPRS